MTRVQIYDTTLRDGAQTEGVSFSCEDKLDILNRLDEFGVDFVEGGWPGSNPRDDEFFERAGRMDLGRAALTAFGSTRRHGIRPEEDQNLIALASCPAGWCCIFGKSWDFQVTDALRIGLEDNLEMIEDSVRFLRGSGKRVMFEPPWPPPRGEGRSGWSSATPTGARSPGRSRLRWRTSC